MSEVAGTLATSGPNAPPGRVLIIDDNTELVGALQAVLVSPPPAEGGGSHLRVMSAAFGEEGLALARTQGFDVAIVDVKLPDMSGVDLIRPLRALVPFGEVVLITGFATMDDAMGALRSGAFAFIPKSFRPEELISTVQQALMKVRLGRERDELERRYRALVELTDVLVVAFDASDRVSFLNPKAASVTGATQELAHGRDFVESWVAPSDRARMREVLTSVRRSSQGHEIETGIEGGRRVRWHLSSAHGEVGTEDTVYGIGIDVTARRLLEKRAADAEALSAMGTLAMNLAHEIRNPLNAAVLQLHLLGRHLDKLDVDGTARKVLHDKATIVGDEIGRLNRLLTEFLELARPRSIAREPVHVGNLVEGVLDLERAQAASRGITLESDVASEGCVALGDSEKLKQVVLNLVMNAFEAMKSGGTLRARVHGEKDAVVLVLADTGGGIDDDVLANVFDPFFTTKEAGTGLGLSIVRKIVDQHAGTISLESRKGSGTTVVVRIPSRPAAP
ncbi:MAG: ATP-binding protein [Polyangiaceae bacterium]